MERMITLALGAAGFHEHEATADNVDDERPNVTVQHRGRDRHFCDLILYADGADAWCVMQGIGDEEEEAAHRLTAIDAAAEVVACIARERTRALLTPSGRNLTPEPLPW